jgi:hypothetical protein
MSNEPIYVNGERLAELHHGTTTERCTLKEAVERFNQLPSERQKVATIWFLGVQYASEQIGRFHFGPNPASI